MINMDYRSTVEYRSQLYPDVTVTLKRVSFSRRNDLTRLLAPLAAKARSLAASTNDKDVAEASMVRREMARLVLEWGIVDVAGIHVDGAPITKQLLLEDGPEELPMEILGELQRQISLDEEQRKN